MKHTAGELSKSVREPGGVDAAARITRVAAPERAGAKDLIYVEAAKHVERAIGSDAVCVVAGQGITLLGKTVLRSEKPKVAFAKAAGILLEPAPIAVGIHPTA